MYDVLVRGKDQDAVLKIDAVLGDPDARRELEQARIDAIREAGGGIG